MWPQLLVLAASMALKYRNERAALKRQERFRGAMESFQRKRSGESMAATEDLLAKQTPEARGSELADITASREQSLRDTVGAAQAFDQPGVAGKKSADYRSAGEAEATRRSETLRRAIEQISTMGATGDQQQAHGLRFGRAAGVVDASNNASEAIRRGYMDDISHVKPNPFANMIADIGIGYGTSGFGTAADVSQGYEDAAGNLYDPDVTTRPAVPTFAESAQDARIRRQIAMKKAFDAYNGGVLGAQ